MTASQDLSSRASCDPPGETRDQAAWSRIFWILVWLLIQNSGMAQRGGEVAWAENGGVQMESIVVTSSAFKHNGKIPKKFTCDAENVSPGLEWGALPARTASIALISDDPDAPMGTWVHWVLYNLPPSTLSLPEGVPPVETINEGGTHGTTSFKTLGYGGPCPPSGTHRYFFKVYALDEKLDLGAGAAKDQVERAMEGHILAQGELMGTYQRS